MQIELLQKYVRQPLVVNQVQFSIPVSNLVANGMEVNMETPGSIDHDGSLLDYCRLHNITLRHGLRFRCRHGKAVFLGSDEYPKLNKKLHVIAENIMSAILLLRYGFTPSGKYADCYRNCK